MLVDHGKGLAAVVVDKLKCFAVPLLPHDLAGERRVIVRRAVDRLAGADAGHVVGVGNLLAVDRRGGELTSLRPREGIVLAVVICDRVAGGREVARLRLAFVEDILGRAVCRHAREQIRPRGVRVAKGLRDRAVFRNTPDVAHRVIGVGAGHAAVGLGRKLALCVVGIRLRGGCRGHIRAAGRDRLDVAGRVVGIVEAAAARAERVGRARQTRTHPVAAVILRDDRIGIAAGVDRGRAPVLVGHSDRLFLKLAQVIVLVLRRDVELVRDRGRDGADRAVDRAVGRAVGLDAGVGILLPVKARAELPRLRCEPVCVVVHVLRELHECAAARRLARMDEPAEAVVRYILYIVTSLTGHRVLHHSIEENRDKTPLLAIRLLLF